MLRAFVMQADNEYFLKDGESKVTSFPHHHLHVNDTVCKSA